MSTGEEEAAAAASSSSSSVRTLTRAPSQSYQYACQRAELLGLPTPTEAEWFASEEYKNECAAAEQDAHDDAVAEELDQNDESMRRIGGGLEELNTILNVTQKKINKFKNVCGSLGTLLKARVSSSSSQPGTPEHKSRTGSLSAEQPSTSEENQVSEDQANPSAGEDEQSSSGDGSGRPIPAPRKVDLNAKVGSHIDKLDSLINKAENAQYSMKHQSKQMKAFLK